MSHGHRSTTNPGAWGMLRGVSPPAPKPRNHPTTRPCPPNPRTQHPATRGSPRESSSFVGSSRSLPTREFEEAACKAGQRRKSRRDGGRCPRTSLSGRAHWHHPPARHSACCRTGRECPARYPGAHPHHRERHAPTGEGPEHPQLRATGAAHGSPDAPSGCSTRPPTRIRGKVKPCSVPPTKFPLGALGKNPDTTGGLLPCFRSTRWCRIQCPRGHCMIAIIKRQYSRTMGTPKTMPRATVLHLRADRSGSHSMRRKGEALPGWVPDQGILAHLADHPNPAVRITVAQHANTSPKTRGLLADDPIDAIRYTVEPPDLPAEVAVVSFGSYQPNLWWTVGGKRAQGIKLTSRWSSLSPLEGAARNIRQAIDASGRTAASHTTIELHGTTPRGEGGATQGTLITAAAPL